MNKFIKSNINGFGYYALRTYVPLRLRTEKKYTFDSSVVIDFKNGKRVESTADEVIRFIIRNINDDISEYLLAVIPASTIEKNELRFKEFTRIVCYKLGINNGFYAIKIEFNREAKHLGGRRIKTFDNLTYNFDIFKDKKVILFDDVITRGDSFSFNAKKLLQFGAKQVIGLFLAKTATESDLNIM